MGNSPLGPRTTVEAMMLPGSRLPMPDVSPLDVIGFPAALYSSSSFKASMVRGMLFSGIQGLRGVPYWSLRGAWPDGEVFDRLDGLLQDLSDGGTEALTSEDVAHVSLERHLDSFEKNLANWKGLVQQRAQERTRLISEWDSLWTKLGGVATTVARVGAAGFRLDGSCQFGQFNCPGDFSPSRREASLASTFLGADGKD
ncbi:hypothetical protein AMTR_s00051p00183730 [Amborella trichopoda]|uniref:Uncharacterized protein n=1 Tax=Amborella trichopoda TaxID=13333 RepID=U5D8H0_AMBTC|nr:hypothetical protein AMTR_s00051p00183730 [Amborella trichopoda]